MENFKGKVWKYKDNINTDIISPPAYMELSIEEAARYAMSPIDESFAKEFKEGDIFVAENNLGSGSSRETAPLTLLKLGVRAIVAKSYARIFYRNCINLGILVIECKDTHLISKDDIIEIDFENGLVRNFTTNQEYKSGKIPQHIIELIRIGGLIPYLENKTKALNQ